MIGTWEKRYIELSITNKCNMACHNCDALVRQAPDTSSLMSVNQIEDFIKESKDNNISWEIIILTGGEPLLHPDIRTIIRELNKAFYPGGVKYKPEYSHLGHKDMDKLPAILDHGLVLLTNGKIKNRFIQTLHDCEQICIVSTDKTNNDQLFYPVNIAPIDNPKYQAELNDEYASIQKLCQCASPCLTQSGYYPCTMGAAIDRVFGIDVGINNIEDVNEDTFNNQFQELCKYCGYFNEIAPFEVPEEHVTETTQTKMSPTWKKALIDYKIKKPKLSTYMYTSNNTCSG